MVQPKAVQQVEATLDRDKWLQVAFYVIPGYKDGKLLDASEVAYEIASKLPATEFTGYSVRYLQNFHVFIAYASHVTPAAISFVLMQQRRNLIRGYGIFPPNRFNPQLVEGSF